MPELHQSGRPAQLQDLHEQIRQGREVALAEVRDGAEVRTVQARDRHDIDPLLTGAGELAGGVEAAAVAVDRKSTRLNSSHANISYAVFCLKKKKKKKQPTKRKPQQ